VNQKKPKSLGKTSAVNSLTCKNEILEPISMDFGSYATSSRQPISQTFEIAQFNEFN
jgi:hypothetical protein